MINKFLRAKHWQLFVLGIVLPFLLYFFMMFSMVFKGFSMSAQEEPNFFGFFEEMSKVLRFLPVVLILSAGILCGWLWSIGKGLQSYIGEANQLNTKWFKISIIFVLVYIVFFSFFMSSFMSNILSQMAEVNGQDFNIIHDDLRSYFYMIAFIFPLHFLAMGCSFYNIYFAAKTIKTVELQREVQFSDYVGEFFMFWFYPIGMWIVQPKINQWIPPK